MQRLNPLNDFIFKKILGEKGDEVQLLSFLNAVLKRSDKLTTVEILENKTLTAELIGDKTSILDVRAITDSGTRVNIELQLRNKGNMDKRSLFYWSKEYSKGIGAGQDYIELPNVVAINIINFEFIPIENFHTTFHLWEDNHRHMLTDALEIHFVDIVKFRRLIGKDIKNNSLHRWLMFFDKDAPEEVLKEVLSMDMAIKRADEKMTFISNDKEALRLYEMREMAMSDYTSTINHAKREGIKEGIKETTREIALSMLKDNLDIHTVMRYTALDESTIKKLKEEISNQQLLS